MRFFCFVLFSGNFSLFFFFSPSSELLPFRSPHTTVQSKSRASSHSGLLLIYGNLGAGIREREKEREMFFSSLLFFKGKLRNRKEEKSDEIDGCQDGWLLLMPRPTLESHSGYLFISSFSMLFPTMASAVLMKNNICTNTEWIYSYSELKYWNKRCTMYHVRTLLTERFWKLVRLRTINDTVT